MHRYPNSQGYAAAGVRVARPAMPAPGALDSGTEQLRMARRGRSVTLDNLPDSSSVRAWFSVITRHQSVTTVSGLFPTRIPIWYGLRSVLVGDDTGGQVALSGVSMTLAPADVNGGGIAGDSADSDPGIAAANADLSALAWGDTRGRTAAIVVGINLPVRPGEWKSAPASIPGIQNSGQGQVSADFSQSGAPYPPNAQAASPEYLIVQHFPPGSFADTGATPNIYPRWTFAPNVRRILEGQTLDVAVVFRRSHITTPNNHTRYVCGLADINLTLSRVSALSDLRNI